MESPRRKIIKICERCNKEFHPVYTSVGRFCSWKCAARKGEEHCMWKGDKISYQGIHSFLRNQKKSKCEFCGEKSNLELALRKGYKHERKIGNYITLCVPCHRKYDIRDPWNKGKRFIKNKICEYCKTSFFPAKRIRRFCSNSCARKKLASPSCLIQ